MHGRAALCRLAGWLACILALAPCLRAAAQSPESAQRAPASCDGDTVTYVEVRSHSPSSPNIADDASRKTRRVIGLPYAPTRPNVVAAYQMRGRAGSARG